MDRQEDSESKKDVSSPGKKSEASTTAGSSTHVPTPMPPLRPERPADEIFAVRWLSADQDVSDEPCCRQVWVEHELLGGLGAGRYGRVFLVKHKPSNTKTALKLCSMRLIGRGFEHQIPRPGSAVFDYKYPPSKFDMTEVEAELEYFRLERLVLRCLSGLCPFVMDIDDRCSYLCVYDDVQGELGFPMKPGVGDLLAIWRELNDQVKGKDSHLVADAVRDLLVFWAAQMADGLRFLHECGIVHGDIRVRNYIMGSDGYIRLADFGRCSVCFPHAPKSVARANLAKLNHLLNNDKCTRLQISKEELMAMAPSAFSTKSLVSRDKCERAGANELKARKYDYFCLAKCLVMLDWPLGEQSVLQQKAACYADTLLKFCPSSSPILRGDLLDFISQLLRQSPGQLLELRHPENLIKHPVFRQINFQQLRKKAIPAPIHPVLKDALPLRPAWNTDLSLHQLALQRQAVPVHRSYCADLSEEQKNLFRAKFIG